MKFTAEIIASFLNGDIIGSSEAVVSSIGKIEDAKEGELAFLSNPKYENFIYTTNASIVLVNRDFEPTSEVNATLIKVDDAYKAFASLLELYVANKPQKRGRSARASISDEATVASDVYVGDFAVIEGGATIGVETKIYPNVYIGDNVKIGDNVTIFANVSIYEECVIGNNVTIHSGTVIGADGFGFAPTKDGYKKIPQIGNVIIEDDVEIGANCCIDRATMGSTIIRRGVKLDNLVQVAHNVVIDEHTVAASQVGVAGSTKIGKWCMFGGQVGMAGHISIADGTQVTSQSGIANSITDAGQIVMGSPAMNASITRRSIVGYKRLPQIMDDISTLKKEIKALKEQLK